jgi:hypothetical protein
MDKKERKHKSFAYKLGYIFGSTLILCLTAMVVAATVKFLFWIF